MVHVMHSEAFRWWESNNLFIALFRGQGVWNVLIYTASIKILRPETLKVVTFRKRI